MRGTRRSSRFAAHDPSPEAACSPPPSEASFTPSLSTRSSTHSVRASSSEEPGDSNDRSLTPESVDEPSTPPPEENAVTTATKRSARKRVLSAKALQADDTDEESDLTDYEEESRALKRTRRRSVSGLKERRGAKVVRSRANDAVPAKGDGAASFKESRDGPTTKQGGGSSKSVVAVDVSSKTTQKTATVPQAVAGKTVSRCKEKGQRTAVARRRVGAKGNTWSARVFGKREEDGLFQVIVHDDPLAVVQATYHPLPSRDPRFRLDDPPHFDLQPLSVVRSSSSVTHPFTSYTFPLPDPHDSTSLGRIVVRVESVERRKKVRGPRTGEGTGDVECGSRERKESAMRGSWVLTVRGKEAKWSTK